MSIPKNFILKDKDDMQPGKGSVCKVAGRCGGCVYINGSYESQLRKKENFVKNKLSGICPVNSIVAMENPYHYRNKVSAAFSYRKGEISSGIYSEGSHSVVNVDSCAIEDETADRIICTIRSLLKSFKIRVYDEDSGYGLLRHVLIRRGFATGEILVVLVAASPIFPSKKNFARELVRLYPEIKSVVLNINDKQTSMVLGQRNIILYGKGYIEDVLCGKRFRISPHSFYQVNPVQTQKLYAKAVELACLTGKETVIDAYCGIGTIGMTAAEHAARVIGVELNRQAVRDAIANAKLNGINNISFIEGDASEVMMQMAAEGRKADVLFMDPPRSGSTEVFMSSVVRLAPRNIVYISCSPMTLARDLPYLTGHGWKAMSATPFDMFPWTQERHVETVVGLRRM